MQGARPPLLTVSAAVLALLGGAAGSGFLASDAAASPSQVGVRKKGEDADGNDNLLLVSNHDESEVLLVCGPRGHSSHSSHSSGHYGGGYSPPDDPPSPPAAPPAPPKPGVVSIVAFPGGQISVDGKPAGHDATSPMVLTPGPHKVSVENRFIGNANEEITVSEGETGEVVVEW